MNSLAIQLENIYYAYNSFLLHLFYVLRSIFELRSWEISLDFVLLSELSMPLEGIRIAGLTAQGNGSCKCRWLMPDQCCQINWIDWASGGEGGSTWKGKKKKRASATRCRCWNMHESKVKSDCCCCCWGAEVPQGVGQAAARYHGLNAFIKTQNAHSGSPKKSGATRDLLPWAVQSAWADPLAPSVPPSSLLLSPFGCVHQCLYLPNGGVAMCSLFTPYPKHTHTLTASSALATHWAFC